MAAPIRYETREVLADAYVPARTQREARITKMHTHTAAIGDDGRATPICNRVQAENLADAGSLDAADRDAPPTCPACQRRLRALAREAIRGTK
jgi:hypothetical protein